MPLELRCCLSTKTKLLARCADHACSTAEIKRLCKRLNEWKIHCNPIVLILQHDRKSLDAWQLKHAKTERVVDLSTKGTQGKRGFLGAHWGRAVPHGWRMAPSWEQ